MLTITATHAACVTTAVGALIALIARFNLHCQAQLTAAQHLMSSTLP